MGRTLRFKADAVGLAPVDRLFINQREIKSGDHFWCKEILAIAESLGRFGLPEDLPGILVILGLLLDIGLGGGAAINRQQLEVRGAGLENDPVNFFFAFLDAAGRIDFFGNSEFGVGIAALTSVGLGLLRAGDGALDDFVHR